MKRILSSILVLAMLLTLVPVTYAEAYDYVIKTGSATYEVKAGEEVSVPVYLTKGDGSDVTLQNIEFTLTIPEGITVTADSIEAGLVSGYNVADSSIIVMQDKSITTTSKAPLFTVKFTAPSAGTYAFEFVGDMILLDENYDLIEGTVGGIGATVTVKNDETPVVPPSYDYDYVIRTGSATYEAKTGEEVSVPVYLTKGDGSDVTLQNIEFTLTIPEGITVTADSIEAGLVSGYNVADSSIIVMQDKSITTTSKAPLFTVKFTAPSAGTYAFEFVGDMILLDENYDLIEGTVGGIGTTLTVTADEGGDTPVVPTVTALTVNPTSIEVPYGVDAYTYVTSVDGITGVTAAYSDNTSGPVTDYEVKISDDGSKAIVTYKEGTAEITLTYGEAPVYDVEIVVATKEITVPYGTADVEAYVKASVGEIKVKDSKDVERVVTDASVAYDAEAKVVTVSYGELESVQIPVNVITLDSYSLAEDTPESIEIPYDVTDVNGYVAGKIKVVGNLSDSTTVAVTDFTVEVGEAVATVKVGDVEVGTVAVTYGQAPEAAITGIEIVADEAIVIPYDVEDVESYIQSKIVVNTIDENGDKAAVDVYTLTCEDGVATVTYSDFTATVEYTLETATIVPSKESIEIPYTVAEEDYAKYIAENVTFTVDYSADTVDETVTVKPENIEIDVDIAVITVKEGSEPVEIKFTVQPRPEYIPEVITSVYGLEGKSLVKITGVAEGKVAVVDGIDATYFGNGTFAVVVDSDKVEAIEFVEVTAMPAEAEFGKLHDSRVTAFDALQANDEALGKEGVEVFNDIQMYIIADINGDGAIESVDAYGINQISLNGSTITWVSAE